MINKSRDSAIHLSTTTHTQTYIYNKVKGSLERRNDGDVRRADTEAVEAVPAARGIFKPWERRKERRGVYERGSRSGSRV